MATIAPWTVSVVEGFPQPLDDTRYEIVDGALFVSSQPSWEHQVTCTNITVALGAWSIETQAGTVAGAPGVIFSEVDAVAPDVVWISRDRIPQVLGNDRKLHSAPDLMVEVLSPGATNERRDRETKLALYSRQGVQEYWIVNWQQQSAAIYRRQTGGLRLATTLNADDTLESPLLPGFTCQVAEFFTGFAG